MLVLRQRGDFVLKSEEEKVLKEYAKRLKEEEKERLQSEDVKTRVNESMKDKPKSVLTHVCYVCSSTNKYRLGNNEQLKIVVSKTGRKYYPICGFCHTENEVDEDDFKKCLSVVDVENYYDIPDCEVEK